MFSEIAFKSILGIPLIVYGGMFSFLLLVITAIIGVLVLKGKSTMFWHKLFAIITIVFAFLHGLLGFLATVFK